LVLVSLIGFDDLIGGPAVHAAVPSVSVWIIIGGVALVAAAVFFLRRAFVRSGAKRPQLPMRCPTCSRTYPRGTLFCPNDAERLVLTAPADSGETRGGGRCPRCRRIFEAGTRFCPVDAEELVPLRLWQGDADEAASGHEHEHLLDGDGKICPVCASKYGLAASFCGRDGSALVTVN
jgi:RNA polymerase subunit RPABC4/transcription elongation factor Spt4